MNNESLYKLGTGLTIMAIIGGVVLKIIANNTTSWQVGFDAELYFAILGISYIVAVSILGCILTKMHSLIIPLGMFLAWSCLQDVLYMSGSPFHRSLLILSKDNLPWYSTDMFFFSVLGTLMTASLYSMYCLYKDKPLLSLRKYK